MSTKKTSAKNIPKGAPLPEELKPDAAAPEAETAADTTIEALGEDALQDDTSEDSPAADEPGTETGTEAEPQVSDSQAEDPASDVEKAPFFEESTPAGTLILEEFAPPKGPPSIGVVLSTVKQTPATGYSTTHPHVRLTGEQSQMLNRFHQALAKNGVQLQEQGDVVGWLMDEMEKTLEEID